MKSVVICGSRRFKSEVKKFAADDELCRHILFREVVSSAKELAKRLR